MTRLADQRCAVCRPDSPRLTGAELDSLRAEIPEWSIVERDGIARLERVFKFPNFADALAFTNRIGALAESHDHHPAITTEWGQVTVTWWTHTIKGLHKNDFILAAKTDEALLR